MTHPATATTALGRCQDAPATSAALTERGALGWLPRTCFKLGPPGRIGVELEYVVHQADSGAAAHLPPDRLLVLHEALRALPLHAAVTTEPGGQVELSSRPADTLDAAIDETAADLRQVVAVAHEHDARLLGVGIDPLPPPPRLLHSPRYQAMESYLGRWGAAGITMMRSTASVQVNLECGSHETDFDSVAQRWRMLHAIGPALSAAFSTSAGHRVRNAAWTGHANQRQAVWRALDPRRCREPAPDLGVDPGPAWANWVLDAPVMLVPRPGSDWKAPPGITFRDWLRSPSVVADHPGPDWDDLRHHLSTLFPPVRARGHLEVRYLDAQPGPWWRVPLAVLHTLTSDDACIREALQICLPTEHAWDRAARWGLADPALLAAADRLLCLARDVLSETPGLSGASLGAMVQEYRTRWTTRGLSPATAPTSEVTPC